MDKSHNDWLIKLDNALSAYCITVVTPVGTAVYWLVLWKILSFEGGIGAQDVYWAIKTLNFDLKAAREKLFYSTKERINGMTSTS